MVLHHVGDNINNFMLMKNWNLAHWHVVYDKWNDETKLKINCATIIILLFLSHAFNISSIWTCDPTFKPNFLMGLTLLFIFYMIF